MMAYLVSSQRVLFIIFPITPLLEAALLTYTCGGLVELLLKRYIFYILTG